MPEIHSGSVKVMRSHDYCHFEVCLASSAATTPEAVDALRKAAARLADKAVEQYRIAKRHAAKRLETPGEKKFLSDEVRYILELPEADRTPNQMAKVKLLVDVAYWDRRESIYDYEDDWGEGDDKDAD